MLDCFYLSSNHSSPFLLDRPESRRCRHEVNVQLALQGVSTSKYGNSRALAFSASARLATGIFCEVVLGSGLRLQCVCETSNWYVL